MDIKDLLWKFYGAGVDHEATLNPKYSFEKTLTNNAQALQLLQSQVSGSVCNHKWENTVKWGSQPMQQCTECNLYRETDH